MKKNKFIPIEKITAEFPRLFKNEFARRKLVYAFSSGGYTYATLFNYTTRKSERVEMWYRWTALKGWSASYSLKG